MSRILFIAQPELGHVLPLLPIARQLRKSGNDVMFMSIPEIEWLFRGWGFATELWDEATDLEHKLELPFTPPRIPSGMSYWHNFARRHGGTRLMGVTARLTAIAQRLQPDHFVVDSLFTFSFGLNCMDAPLYGHATIISSSLGRWDDLPSTIPVPLLYLCPAVFEVPRYVIKHPLVTYCEPSCSQPFAEANVILPSMVRGRSLVLVTGGTQGSLQTHLLRRISAVSDVAAKYKDLDFVISISDRHARAFARYREELGENILFRSNIPQQRLLSQAIVLVTHGGLSSMKEAILAGVPMIVTPEVFDQPYNAMRAVHHGLAPAIFPDEMGASVFELALKHTLENNNTRVDIQRFQTLFAEADAHPKAARIIENRLLDPNSSSWR